MKYISLLITISIFLLSCDDKINNITDPEDLTDTIDLVDFEPRPITLEDLYGCWEIFDNRDSKYKSSENYYFWRIMGSDSIALEWQDTSTSFYQSVPTRDIARCFFDEENQTIMYPISCNFYSYKLELIGENEILYQLSNSNTYSIMKRIDCEYYIIPENSFSAEISNNVNFSTSGEDVRWDAYMSDEYNRFNAVSEINGIEYEIDIYDNPEFQDGGRINIKTNNDYYRYNFESTNVEFTDYGSYIEGSFNANYFDELNNENVIISNGRFRIDKRVAVRVPIPSG